MAYLNYPWLLTSECEFSAALRVYPNYALSTLVAHFYPASDTRFGLVSSTTSGGRAKHNARYFCANKSFEGESSGMGKITSLTARFNISLINKATKLSKSGIFRA